MRRYLDRLPLQNPPGDWIAGGITQIRVIGALMIRDAMSRFGHDNIGFFWVIGEPMLLTCGVMALWTISNQTHDTGVGVVPFALTGYSYITLWRHIVQKSVRVMTFNAALCFHHQVRFVDLLIARALLETVSIFSAFTVTYIPLALLGFAPIVRDPLLMLGGWLLGGWFSFAFGLIIAAISELSEPVERFIQPAMYLTIPITGVFFMLDWLPEAAQKALLWSPLVTGIEMFRGGLFPVEIMTHYAPLYTALWCAALTAIGLPLCGYAQRHVQLL